MINEIWKSIKTTFTVTYEKILKIIIKPLYVTLALFCIYFFMVSLINYKIVLAFINLFLAILFFNFFEEE